MLFTIVDESGAEIDFECADSLSSRWTCGAILEGRTYPHLPFVGPVGTILDVGANCGALTAYLARHHPDAVIHAFEPGSEAMEILRRNVGHLPNVRIHPFGLADVDRKADLFLDHEDIGKASVVPPAQEDAPARAVEAVELRSAGGWAAEHGIDRIDILKIDVEGCEVQVIESLGSLVQGAKVIYIEYDGRVARRRLAELIEPTHELYLGTFLTLDQGECLYLRKDLADHPDVTARLREIFVRGST